MASLARSQRRGRHLPVKGCARDQRQRVRVRPHKDLRKDAESRRTPRRIQERAFGRPRDLDSENVARSRHEVALGSPQRLANRHLEFLEALEGQIEYRRKATSPPSRVGRKDVATPMSLLARESL